MNLKNLKYLFFLLMAVVTLSSCSETSEDESASEYANWQSRNDEYFDKVLANAKTASGWTTFLTYSLDNQTGNKDANGNVYQPTYANNEYIAVEKLQNVMEADGVIPTRISPLFTDSVRVAYQGHLMPTTEHPDGYCFDGTFEESSYNKETSASTKFLTSGLVDGFSTALTHMQLGDHWIVYIPANLGYGSDTSKSAIPAYSMLRFELVLLGVKKGNTWIVK